MEHHMLAVFEQTMAAEGQQVVAVVATAVGATLSVLTGLGWVVRGNAKIDKKVGVLCERLSTHMKNSPTRPGVTSEIGIANDRTRDDLTEKLIDVTREVHGIDGRLDKVEQTCAAEHQRLI